MKKKNRSLAKRVAIILTDVVAGISLVLILMSVMNIADLGKYMQLGDTRTAIAGILLFITSPSLLLIWGGYGIGASIVRRRKTARENKELYESRKPLPTREEIQSKYGEGGEGS